MSMEEVAKKTCSASKPEAGDADLQYATLARLRLLFLVPAIACALALAPAHDPSLALALLFHIHVTSSRGLPEAVAEHEVACQTGTQIGLDKGARCAEAIGGQADEREGGTLDCRTFYPRNDTALRVTSEPARSSPTTSAAIW